MKAKAYVKCELGYWELEEKNGVITALNFIGDLDSQKNGSTLNSNPTLNEAKRQLEEYFNGERREFSLAISLEGTNFQQKVWQALQEIPYGTTKSYQEVATIVGNKNSMRAVGGANHNNPISIIVPCHRVIGKNGSLVGYGGGLDVKAYLLALEAKYL